MSKIIIDSSILIRFLNKEKGWEKILLVLENDIFMSSLNLAEFYTWWIRNGYDFEKAKSIISKMDIEIINYDSSLAEKSAEVYLKTKNYGLSLGDRACLVSSLAENIKVYTCDKVWQNLQKDLILEIF